METQPDHIRGAGNCCLDDSAADSRGQHNWPSWLHLLDLMFLLPEVRLPNLRLMYVRSDIVHRTHRDRMAASNAVSGLRYRASGGRPNPP